MTFRTLLIMGVLAINSLAGNPTQAAEEETVSLRTVLARYPGAIRKAPTVEPELAQRLFRRGNTYSNLERYDQAIEEFEKSIVADPNFAEAYRSLANTYYSLERFQEAKPTFARYIALTLDQEPTPAIRTAIATLGDLEREDGNFEESIALDLKSIELDPGNDSLVHIMGNTYNNAGATDKAIRIYQAGIETRPDNAYFYRTVGRFLEQEGRLQEALEQYQQAAERDPDSDFYATLVENLRARLEP
ncbi:MAG: tetratricopeptide repeat protein [Gammaproteobacteria bacterium]|nr:tetratricopeptide repeat protein [Pseudomonadales bacterium]MCP5345381.1 tetratricopeptide repeat protein [Pseudomonadales bacterium]